MNKSLIPFLLLAFFLFFVVIEMTILNFPFVFLYCSALLVLFKKNYTSLGVFCGGIVIDSLRVDGFGLTPLFLVLTILIILIYEKYSGSSDLLLAGVIIALFTFIYARVLGYSILLTVSFIVLSFILWQVYRIMQKKSYISI